MFVFETKSRNLEQLLVIKGSLVNVALVKKNCSLKTLHILYIYIYKIQVIPHPHVSQPQLHYSDVSILKALTFSNCYFSVCLSTMLMSLHTMHLICTRRLKNNNGKKKKLASTWFWHSSGAASAFPDRRRSTLSQYLSNSSIMLAQQTHAGRCVPFEEQQSTPWLIFGVGWFWFVAFVQLVWKQTQPVPVLRLKMCEMPAQSTKTLQISKSRSAPTLCDLVSL